MPALFFFNPYTVLAGNIQALPNINRTLELVVNHKSLFVALHYTVDDAPIVKYATPLLDQANNLLFWISNNIESRNHLGLNVDFPLGITDFWQSNYSIGSYWRKDKVRFADALIEVSNPFLSIDMTHSFRLPNDWSLELSGRWNSVVWQGTIYQPEQTFVNFGVQKRFKNSTLGLSWTDIFNTGSFNGFNNDLPEQGVVYDWIYDLEGGIVRVSYTYNFGGKVRKARDSGADDVLKRVND